MKANLLKIFDGENIKGNIYACPQRLQPLDLIIRYYGFNKECFFLDKAYGTKYKVEENYADFVNIYNTNNINLNGKNNIINKPAQTIFQNPFMSAIYERGYRQNFERAGFPGINKEFEEASSFFQAAKCDDTILDLSCGSGFMTRKFIKSKK